MQVAAVSGKEPKSLFELETTVAHNLTVDLDFHAISTNSERARAQIVDVLTAINSEVGACVNGAGVNALVDLLLPPVPVRYTATVAGLVATAKEQATQIQKVTAQFEASRATGQGVVSNR